MSSFDSTPLALQELANGNADVVVSDVPAILDAIDQAKLTGLCISCESLDTECYGIALPLRSPILPAVNQGIKALIADGTYARLYSEWFASDPPVLLDLAPAQPQSTAVLPVLICGCWL